jgi:uncharacterized protein YigA (DUF484 family)
MSRVISFEQHAVASLRARLGAAEETNQDLIAFARGHSGAVAAIHSATLAALEAESIPDLLRIVTHVWPANLGVDTAAIALRIGNRAFRADRAGIHALDALFFSRALRRIGPVDMRRVDRGHAWFGTSSEVVGAEALVRIDNPLPFPSGALLLGQREARDFDARHGSELLRFLGQGLAVMIRRWTSDPTSR